MGHEQTWGCVAGVGWPATTLPVASPQRRCVAFFNSPALPDMTTLRQKCFNRFKLHQTPLAPRNKAGERGDMLLLHDQSCRGLALLFLYDSVCDARTALFARLAMFGMPQCFGALAKSLCSRLCCSSRIDQIALTKKMAWPHACAAQVTLLCMLCEEPL